MRTGPAGTGQNDREWGGIGMVVRAHIEHLASVVRVIDNGFGDEYGFTATVRWLSSKRVEIIGVTKAPTIAEWRAVFSSLAGLGVDSFQFARVRHGEFEYRIHKTRAMDDV